MDHMERRQNEELMEARRLRRQEQKRKLTEYFSQHDFLTRRDLQFLLGLKKSTAVSLLRQWRQAGLLLNKGTDRQPIYVPAPGCFGR